MPTTRAKPQVLLAPAAGGLVVGLFIYFFLPGRRPQGVADVIEAEQIHGGWMSSRVGFLSAVASALSIGAGASVGREGPAVHLGASLGAWLARRLHLTRSLNRTLLGCGVAAAAHLADGRRRQWWRRRRQHDGLIERFLVVRGAPALHCRYDNDAQADATANRLPHCFGSDRSGHRHCGCRTEHDCERAADCVRRSDSKDYHRFGGRSELIEH